MEEQKVFVEMSLSKIIDWSNYVQYRNILLAALCIGFGVCLWQVYVGASAPDTVSQCLLLSCRLQQLLPFVLI